MLKRKLASDSVWSYAAFGVMAISGLGLNLLIGAVFGPTGLGVFSQVMAVFVIVSHFSVVGLHNAAFRAIALTPDDARSILAAAVVATLPFATATTILLILGAPVIGRALDSPDTGAAILWMAPGILFFGINKVGLAALNAMTMMRRHAIGQMLRYLTIGSVVAAVVATDDGPHRLGAAFTAAEVVVTLYLIGATAPLRAAGSARGTMHQAMTMLRFGLRSTGAGLLTEMNLRIDTLMLGWYLPDREVGIYAFAALLIEGLGNIALVLRTLVNPYLTRLLASGDTAAIRILVGRIQLIAWPVVVVAFLGAWLLYQPAIRLAVGPGDLELALAPLLILIALMAPYFTYSAFEETLMLCGHAGTQSLYQLIVTATNIALNLALIPLLGLNGAAIATGLASLLACIALVTTVYRTTGYLLLPQPGMRLFPLSKGR
jgi:O-antigen/teichoic acid export membrane protein